MKPYARTFSPPDAYRIKLRELDLMDYEGMSYRGLAFDHWGRSQIAQTIMAGKDVVACGGVRIIGREGSAWILSSALVNKYPLFFHKTVKSWLDSAFNDFGCVRVATFVYVENVVSAKWVERLGMIKEGTMHKCGPNALDRHIYARWIE